MAQETSNYGLRIPADVMNALNARCDRVGVHRSRVIIAALRKYLNLPDPAAAVRTARRDG